VNDERQRTRNQQGGGLIELLVSVVLLSIVLVGTLSLQVTAIRNGSEPRFTSAAMTVAQRRLEELRSTGWSSLTCNGTTCRCLALDTQPLGSETRADCFCSGSFRRVTAFSTVAVGPVNACRSVVTVSWVSNKGEQSVVQAMDGAPGAIPRPHAAGLTLVEGGRPSPGQRLMP
jgi:type II secretory pathway pseudopilin PulG